MTYSLRPRNIQTRRINRKILTKNLPDNVRYIGKGITQRLGGRYMAPSYFMLPTEGQNRFSFNQQMSDMYIGSLFECSD